MTYWNLLPQVSEGCGYRELVTNQCYLGTAEYDTQLYNLPYLVMAKDHR